MFDHPLLALDAILVLFAADLQMYSIRQGHSIIYSTEPNIYPNASDMLRSSS